MNVPIPCICAPKGDELRHPDGDQVQLRDRLDFRTAATIQKAAWVLDDPSSPEILAALTEAYLLYCIGSWTLQDARGKAIPVTRAAVEEHLLPNLDAAFAVADAADDLYRDTVLLPLLERASRSSETSSTTASTSQPTSSQPVPLTPSKRSSTSTTRTGSTATTSSSPDGDSNSSQNSASAA